jgi:hypothetical protein
MKVMDILAMTTYFFLEGVEDIDKQIGTRLPFRHDLSLWCTRDRPSPETCMEWKAKGTQGKKKDHDKTKR